MNGAWVLLSCGHWQVALPALEVRRLVLADAVRHLAAAPTGHAGPGLALIDGQAVPVWDLSRLLDGPGCAADAPTVLVEGCALTVDRCLSVGPLPGIIPLPPGTCPRAHAVAPLDKPSGPPFALVLDLQRLLTAEERAASRRVVS